MTPAFSLSQRLSLLLMVIACLNISIAKASDSSTKKRSSALQSSLRSPCITAMVLATFENGISESPLGRFLTKPQQKSVIDRSVSQEPATLVDEVADRLPTVLLGIVMEYAKEVSVKHDVAPPGNFKANHHYLSDKGLLLPYPQGYFLGSPCDPAEAPQCIENNPFYVNSSTSSPALKHIETGEEISLPPTATHLLHWNKSGTIRLYDSIFGIMCQYKKQTTMKSALLLSSAFERAQNPHCTFQLWYNKICISPDNSTILVSSYGTTNTLFSIWRYNLTDDSWDRMIYGNTLKGASRHIPPLLSYDGNHLITIRDSDSFVIHDLQKREILKTLPIWDHRLLHYYCQGDSREQSLITFGGSDSRLIITRHPIGNGNPESLYKSGEAIRLPLVQGLSALVSPNKAHFFLPTNNNGEPLIGIQGSID